MVKLGDAPLNRRPRVGFDEILVGIQTLGSAISPDLKLIKELWADAASFYTELTGVQTNYIKNALSLALVRKVISWNFPISDVSHSALWSSMAGHAIQSRDRMGGGILKWLGLRANPPTPINGPWLEHRELTGYAITGLVTVACQLPNANQALLSKGQTVLATGNIAVIDIYWPSLSIILDNINIRISNQTTIQPTRINLLSESQRESGVQTDPVHASSNLLGSVEGSPDTIQPSRIYERPTSEGSYQTAPLGQYSRRWRELAEELFVLLSTDVPGKSRRYKGSYSILGSSSAETAAKIIIYEKGIGKTNQLPLMDDGVYVLIRTNGSVGESIWRADSSFFSPVFRGRLKREKTIGVAPKHAERFSYFRIETGEDLKTIASLLASCSQE